MDWTISDVDYSPKDTTGVEGFVTSVEMELSGEEPTVEGFHLLNAPLTGNSVSINNDNLVGSSTRNIS